MAEGRLPQFENKYDVGKMRVLADIIEKNFRNFISGLSTAGNLDRSLTGSQTGDYTFLSTDARIEFLITVAAAATLPDPTLVRGKEYNIINNYSSLANVTFNYSILGDSTFELMPCESIDVYSNGTEYMVD